jgi:acyl CoA:acetate/3-ketoacid CoA transferase alpha subunit
MVWEYCQLEVKTGGFATSRIPDNCIAELNRLGQEGWELIQAIPTARAFGRTDFITFLFKREIR